MDNMIVYKENHRKPHQKKCHNELVSLHGHRIQDQYIVQKSIVFLYTSNKQLETKILKIVLFSSTQIYNYKYL